MQVWLYYAGMTVIQLDYFSFEILRQITKQLSLTYNYINKHSS